MRVSFGFGQVTLAPLNINIRRAAPFFLPISACIAETIHKVPTYLLTYSISFFKLRYIHLYESTSIFYVY